MRISDWSSDVCSSDLLHADHVGGLLTPDAALAFPEATVHLSAPEWAAMQADADPTDLVAAIKPHVAAFEPGSELVPGLLTAVRDVRTTHGTPPYLLTSGHDHLLSTSVPLPPPRLPGTRHAIT